MMLQPLCSSGKGLAYISLALCWHSLVLEENMLAGSSWNHFQQKMSASLKVLFFWLID